MEKEKKIIGREGEEKKEKQKKKIIPLRSPTCKSFAVD